MIYFINFFRRRSNYKPSLAKRDGSEQNVMITNVHSSLNNMLAARSAAKGGGKDVEIKESDQRQVRWNDNLC